MAQTTENLRAVLVMFLDQHRNTITHVESMLNEAGAVMSEIVRLRPELENTSLHSPLAERYYNLAFKLPRMTNECETMRKTLKLMQQMLSRGVLTRRQMYKVGSGIKKLHDSTTHTLHRAMVIRDGIISGKDIDIYIANDKRDITGVVKRANKCHCFFDLNSTNFQSNNK